MINIDSFLDNLEHVILELRMKKIALCFIKLNKWEVCYRDAHQQWHIIDQLVKTIRLSISTTDFIYRSEIYNNPIAISSNYITGFTQVLKNQSRIFLIQIQRLEYLLHV